MIMSAFYYAAETASQLLENVLGNEVGTTSHKFFVCRLWSLFKDESLTVTVDLIHENAPCGANDVFDDDISLTLLKSGFAKGGHAPTIHSSD